MTIVSIALKDIAASLNSPLPVVQWSVTAYTLAAACTVVFAAWAGRWAGEKRVWLTSLWLFLAGAVVSAIASDVTMLIAARVVQGAGTGLLLPTMQTIVVRSIGQQKTKASLAAIGIPSVLAPILGSTIGGLVLEYMTWRMIFWLHLPACLLAIFLAERNIPPALKREIVAFDLRGAVLFCPAITLTIYGLSSIPAESGAFPALGITCTAAGASMFSAFILHSAKRRENALLDLTLLALRDVRQSCGLLLLSSVIYYGGVLLFPLYLIQGASYSAFAAGVLVALHGLGTLVARYQATRCSNCYSDRDIAAIGVAATLAGSIILAIPVSVDAPIAVAAGMLLRGGGTGLLTLLAMAGAYKGISHLQAVHVSALTRVATLLGASLGAVIAGWWLPSGMEGSPPATEPKFITAQLVLIAVAGACCIALPRRQT